MGEIMKSDVYVRQVTFDGTWDELFDTFAYSVSQTRTATLYDRGHELEVLNGIDVSDMSAWSERNFEEMLEGTEFVGRLAEAGLYARYVLKSVGGNRYEFSFEGYLVSFYRGMSEKPYVIVVRENSEDLTLNHMTFAEDLLIDTNGLGYM